jgi:TctA family transporter
MMERALRASLQLSQGDFSIMWGSGISKVLLAMAALMILTSGMKLLPARSGLLREES